ncbi:MAG: prepilin-type N-terminal cleavage/methylation domain-containing protein [Lachnospiraceae bacterium]|nr:prepilin-type N-terminal cleavage/methylation domain-containing protein [Lachnospiraceae bacterium]
MRKRFEELKKDQKGFTLVELIVVLVILAIMAALLAPALLGYIDKARTSKYLEECRSIYTATQAIYDEHYAKGNSTFTFTSGGTDLDELNKLVYPTVATSITIKTLEQKKGTANADKKDTYIIDYISALTFTSQDGSTITANQDNQGNWTVSNVESSSTNSTHNG